VIVRLTSLLFAVAIVIAGLSEQSLALVALSSGIVMVALIGVGAEPAERGRSLRALADPKSWRVPDLPSGALTTMLVALGCCLLSIGLASPTALSLLSTLAWVAGIVGAVILGPMIDRFTVAEMRDGLRAALSREYRPEIGSVLIMTAVAFALRIYHLESVPPMVHGDEGIVGLMALRILDGQRPPLLAVDAAWPQAYLYTYLVALSMKLFGADVFGLRVLGVVFGTLGVPIIYALGRVGWGPLAGAIAAWLFVVSHLQNHYSRLGTFVIESVPLMALVLLLLALAYERGRTSDHGDRAGTTTRRGVWTLLLLAGLACGFAQYFYYGSRVIPIVAAPLLLLLWRRRCIAVWQAAAFGLGFFIIAAPLGAHFLEYPDRFSGRLSEVSIFREGYVRQTLGEGASFPTALPALLAEQSRRSLNLFIRGGDQGGFYSGNTPNFDVVTAALIWLGLGAALSRPRRFHEALALLWFGLGLLFSSVLTLGAQSGQRMLIVTPAAFLFGGILFGRVWELMRGLPMGRIGGLVVPAGTTLALWLLAANVTTYFYEYAPRGELAEQAAVAREIADDGGKYHVYFLTSPLFDPNHDAIKFIARGVPAINLRRAADFTPPPADGLGLKFIVLEDHLPDLRAIEAQIPPGEERRVNAGNGRLMFIVYTVPPVR
jgi:4-amino-4-deoxy-L-arabinose transferase-like glycosyltransferase